MERFAQLGKSCAPFARGDWNAACASSWSATSGRRLPLCTEAMLLLESVAGSVSCTLTVSVTLSAVDRVSFVL